MRRFGILLIACSLLLLDADGAIAREWWKTRLDKTIKKAPMGVAVRFDGSQIYSHQDRARRVPASNQKLLMSMALLDAVGAQRRFATTAAAAVAPNGGVLHGDLWLRGFGDPAVASGGRFARSLPFPPTRIRKVARLLKAAGIRSVTGGVVGSTGYFAHDWYAPGWKSNFPADEVALPTALTLDGNVRSGHHIDNPEFWAARALTRRLRGSGIRVAQRPSSAPSPSGLITLARVRSQPLERLLAFTNRWSSNFFAEVLGKRLAVARRGPPGTIAGGADAIEAWAAARGVGLQANDSSGLSYSNLVSPGGMSRLLEFAATRPWIDALRSGLPKGDQGTLEDRLEKVQVRAKTGTLTYVSTLSGWVWLSQSGEWAEFSIMSRGLSKSTAVEIENAIVRTLYRYAN